MILPIFEIFVFIVLTIFVAILLREYLRLHSSYEKLQKERVDVEYKARQRAVQLVEEARNRAEEIMQKATAQALAEQRDVSADLHKISSEQQEMYTKMLQNISKDVEVEAVREFQELKMAIGKESETLQSELRTKLRAEYEQAQKELEAFKQARLREIKAGLTEMVIDISRTLVGRSIPSEVHTEFAEKLLTEGKQKYGL